MHLFNAALNLSIIIFYPFLDFEDALTHHYDKNVEILADALMLSASVLTKQPQMVGPQIIGRLLPLLPSYEKVCDFLKYILE